ncbi:MAG: AbrB/MazE/SpoVT family DNA-binding domain-containing protein [Terracidiphilus sp.]
MPSKISYIPAASVEATVSSKGQVTLPKALRSCLGIDTGSRIRFSLAPHGGFEARPVLYDLEDLWKMADAMEASEEGRSGKARRVLTFAEMNEAKARRAW